MLLNLISAGRTAMKWNFDNFQGIHATDFGAARRSRPWPILKADQSRKTRAKLVGRAALHSAVECPKDPRRRFINLFAPPRGGCLTFLFWGRRRLALQQPPSTVQIFEIRASSIQHPRRDNNDLRWKREPLHRQSPPFPLQKDPARRWWWWWLNCRTQMAELD